MISVISLDLEKAPLRLRKALQYSGDEIRHAGSVLAHKTRASFILLITCNRAEVWAEDNGEMSVSLIARSLSMKENEVAPYVSSLKGEDACYYLYRLSSGILSPYFGEEVIISQISLAAECARSIGSISAELDQLFRSAVSFARRVHNLMKVRVFDMERVLAIPPLLKGRHVLLIGSGEEARLIASTLRDNGFEVVQCVRDISKADFLVPRGVRAVGYDSRLEYTSWAESVISASSGIGYTLSAEEIKLFGGALLLDLASPSDFPPDVDAIRFIDAPSPLRDSVICRVNELAQKETLAFSAYLEKRKNLPIAEEIAVNTASVFIRKVSALLELDKNESLASSLYEECRKASISAYYKTSRRH